jgi:salicylate hydroxylase
MLQYLAQGRCMALEDAVTLGEALRASGDSSAASRATSARASRAPRAWCCSRARWGASIMRKASSAWCATTCGRAARPQRYYDALEWLYGWRVEDCLRRGDDMTTRDLRPSASSSTSASIPTTWRRLWTR